MKSRSAATRRYMAALRRLMERAHAAGITHQHFQTIFDDSLHVLQKQNKPNKRKFRALQVILSIILLTVILYILNLLFDDKPLNLFLCKIQEFIYPGLRMLRLIFIPVVSSFPSLTELYDETCLIQNPFFRINNMDCWPCYSINHIIEMTDADVPFEPQTTPPFIYKTNQKHITYADLQTVYLENKKVFDENSPKIIINNKGTITTSDFFDFYNGTGTNSYKWRLNRMLPALLIRTLFPRPGVIPRLGQSTERFVMIDDPGSMSYQLPEPECNYVFVIQTRGERLIELQPTKECIDKCNTVKMLLPASYMLWYNWWYWRPISHTTELNSTSISYIGSYC